VRFVSPTSPQAGCAGGLRRALCVAALSCLIPAWSLAQVAAHAPPVSAAAAGVALTGLVADSTGAIIPNARVELMRLNGTLVVAGSTDSAGQFRIISPSAAGEFRLVVTLAGFEPVIRPLKLGSGSPSPLSLTMTPANVATSVDVNASEAADVAAPENNADSASMSANDMKTLPILDGDIVATLSAFLDAGAAGETGTTLVVDGVEVSQLGFAPSAIERVSMNQNPYSAQYRSPGRGQVEIITKQAAEKFHGSASYTIRDSVFNAANYFSTTKPPEIRQTVEGFLTGPIRPLRQTGFLFSVLHQEQNSYLQVNALAAPPGVATTSNVLAPYRNTNLTMKVNHQINEHHSENVVYRFFDTMYRNRTVGGLVLATAGYSDFYFGSDITFHDDDAFGSNKFNQFNILFERNSERTVNVDEEPAIIVEGAFTGGGAQNDSLQTENNPNISDIVSWTVGKNQIKFGVQLPNLGRRVLDDETNRQGTYTFATLAAYAQNTPASFSLQQGQSRFITHYDQPGAFFLDQIQATARLTVTPGVRYDFQNAIPGTMDAIQPKLALAYVVDKDHALVVRAGGGVYMRRVGVNVGQQLARYQYAAERSLLLTTGVTYPETNVMATSLPSLFNFVRGIKAPFQGFFGMSVERELTKKSTVTIGYEGYRGWHALESIDINAPLPPFVSAVRPNPNFSQVLQLHSGGVQRSDALIASFRGRLGHYFSGFSQYTWQHARADTEFSTFTPQNQYAPDDEYGRTNADERQKLNLFGTFYPDAPLNLGVGFYANTPEPYTELTGMDNYYTGLFNARPAGIPRNSLNGGSYQDVELRLGYTFKLRPRLKDASPSVALSLSSFNTLNRVNYEDYVGVVTSPDFMKPITAATARKLQFGASYSF
jgi:hypothetical protein